MCIGRMMVLVFAAFFFAACEPAMDCENADIETFDSFLGVGPNTGETELVDKLGAFTWGYYSEDNRQFTYDFFAVPDVMVSVVVNAASSKVETVIMEVLTLGEDFKKDLAAGIDYFKMTDCDSRFFGMNREELLSDMGQPSEESVEERSGATVLTYFSKNYRTEVRFKLYPVQDNSCSAVIVNWYH